MLDDTRRAEITEAFQTAKAMLPQQCPFSNIAIPTNVPAMARRIAGDVLGWPLHLRHRSGDDEPGMPIVTPIMRHKPTGVTLLEARRRVPRPATETSSYTAGGEYDALEEQTVEQPISSSPQDAFPIGTEVKKMYDGQLYVGNVARVDDFATGRYYLVIYHDGNQEHVTADELAKLVSA